MFIQPINFNAYKNNRQKINNIRLTNPVKSDTLSFTGIEKSFVDLSKILCLSGNKSKIKDKQIKSLVEKLLKISESAKKDGNKYTKTLEDFLKKGSAHSYNGYIRINDKNERIIFRSGAEAVVSPNIIVHFSFEDGIIKPITSFHIGEKMDPTAPFVVTSFDKQSATKMNISNNKVYKYEFEDEKDGTFVRLLPSKKGFKCNIAGNGSDIEIAYDPRNPESNFYTQYNIDGTIEKFIYNQETSIWEKYETGAGKNSGNVVDFNSYVRH